MKDDDGRKQGLSLPRRNFLALTGALVAAPYVLTRRADAAQRVVVRTPGGSYDDIRRKIIYDPFTKKTGIEVVPVAATEAKLLAMFKAGSPGLDVIDTGDDPLIQLQRMGALAPIPYSDFRFTDPNNLDPKLKLKYRVGNFTYASVLGYNTTTFPHATEPKSWAQFWDAKKFPGPRMLAGMSSGEPNLEFALIADGVPMHKLYPLDIDRAFKSLSRIRPQVTKFWNTGAMSAQLLANKEVVLGAVWHTRITNLIEKGLPLAIQWNQSMIQVQAYSIAKNAHNPSGAAKFVDFCCSPDIQAKFATKWRVGPSNLKSFHLMPAAVLHDIPTSPAHRKEAFYLNAEWWADNRSKVSDYWNNWILS